MHNIYYATNICLSSGVFPFIIPVFSIGYAFCQKLTVAKKTVTAICVRLINGYPLSLKAAQGVSFLIG